MTPPLAAAPPYIASPAVRPHPAAPALIEALQRLDLTSADGRAGIACLLAELERLAPDALRRQAAILDLRLMGCRTV